MTSRNNSAVTPPVPSSTDGPDLRVAAEAEDGLAQALRHRLHQEAGQLGLRRHPGDAALHRGGLLLQRVRH